MRELLITTDPVLLSFAQSVLADAGIDVLLADQFTSAVEGSLGIIPRRLLVSDDHWSKARWELGAAGLGRELVADTRPAADQLSRR